MNGAETPLAVKPFDERIKGVVRALLALMFGGSVCYGFLWGRIGNVTLVSPDAFSNLAMAVILWWFAREMSEQRARETAAAVAAAVSPPTTTITTPSPSTTVTIAPPPPTP